MTFKSMLAAFIGTEILILVLHALFSVSLAWLLLPLSLSLLMLVYGSACIQSSFFAPALCRGATIERQIALSFDDGPTEAYTQPILELLAEYKVPAAFFIIGKNIKGNEAILKQMDRAGHIIGNHSYTHSPFIDLKLEQGLKNELMQTEAAVFALTGKRPALFRPPFGVMTPHLAKAVKLLDVVIVGWTVRSLDTTMEPAETIVKRIQSQLKPGAVILMHDTSAKSVEVLKQILDFTVYNDYKIVAIDRLLNIEPYKKNNQQP